MKTHGIQIQQTSFAEYKDDTPLKWKWKPQRSAVQIQIVLTQCKKERIPSNNYNIIKQRKRVWQQK
jgi:hypothetical protein